MHMSCHLIVAGIVDDPYLDRMWILIALSIGGSMLCFYRYKIGFIVIPIVTLVASVFLKHFYETDTYRRITTIANRTPRPIVGAITCLLLPIAMTCVAWFKSRKKPDARA